VGLALYPVEILIKLQEHILGHFFGDLVVAQKTQRDAEDHRLIGPDQPGKFQSHRHYYGATRLENANLFILVGPK